MNLEDRLTYYLIRILELADINGIMLLQRDGTYIHSIGKPFSKRKAQTFASICAALFSLGISLHSEEYQHIFIHGNHESNLIMSFRSFKKLNNSLRRLLRLAQEQGILEANLTEYLIVVSFRSLLKVKTLEEFLDKSRQVLLNIKTSLITSGESFKPPLIQSEGAYEQHATYLPMNLKKTKNHFLSRKHKSKLKLALSKILRDHLNLNYVGITFDSGYFLYKHVNQSSENTSRGAIEYSLLQFAALYYRLGRTGLLSRLFWRKKLKYIALYDGEKTYGMKFSGRACLSWEYDHSLETQDAMAEYPVFPYRSFYKLIKKIT